MPRRRDRRRSRDEGRGRYGQSGSIDYGKEKFGGRSGSRGRELRRLLFRRGG